MEKSDAIERYRAAVVNGYNLSLTDWNKLSATEQDMYLTQVPASRRRIDPKIFSHDRWDQLLMNEFEEIKSLARLKGGEYSGDEDRLLNFRRNAEALGLDMKQVWAVYSAKHWDAIMQYVKDIATGKKRSRLETPLGRCRDLIVYLLLFEAMLLEAAED